MKRQQLLEDVHREIAAAWLDLERAMLQQSQHRVPIPEALRLVDALQKRESLAQQLLELSGEPGSIGSSQY